MKPAILITAAAVLVAAACTRDAADPAGPTIVGGPSPVAGLFAVIPDSSASDSVVAGYGREACGGLEYWSFEYDPATRTEYVVCADTTVEPTDTTWLPYTRTEPSPPPPTTSPAPAPVRTCPDTTRITDPADTVAWIGPCTDPIEYPDPPYDP